MIDPLVKKNPWLLAAGLAMLLYGGIEIGDSLYVFPLAAGWIPELYPTFVFQEIERLLMDNPLSLFPLFVFFAASRVIAALGVLKNRLWGFWMGLFISSATVVWVVFFLPLSGIEMLACLFIVTALLLGHFGKTPLVLDETRKE